MNRQQRIRTLVAEHVMGWTPIPVEGKRPMWRTPDGRITGEREIPDYPNDIAAAWTVMEKMLAGYNCDIFAENLAHYAKKQAGHPCTYTIDMALAILRHLAPKNICEAALRALGVPIPDEEKPLDELFRVSNELGLYDPTEEE